MYLNFKYRLKPNKSQKMFLEHNFFIVNQVWNFCLNKFQEESKLKSYSSIKSYEKLVGEYLKERKLSYNSGMVQQEIKKFFESLKIKLKKKDGFLNFKKSSLIQQSFEFKNQSISINHSHFKIMKQKIKIIYHRELPGFPKKIIVKREADGKFYLICSVQVQNQEETYTGVDCGIDMNVNNISIAESNGTVTLNTITKLAKYNKKYLKIQKKLSVRYEAKNYSKNTKKLQKNLNKIHKKVSNVKNNFFHILSRILVKNFDRITIENLEIKQMLTSKKGKRLNRSISDVSWGSLVAMLQYKSELFNKTLIKIHPAYTSQRCFSCGHIERKNRQGQANFECKLCGHKDNADKNAAKNILHYEDWVVDQKKLLEQKALALA